MAQTKATRTMRELANYYLEYTSDELQRERFAIAGFLETTLLSLNDYNGFRYLDSAGVTHEPKFSAVDESRRRYL
jgi:hypothetical protein